MELEEENILILYVSKFFKTARMDNFCTFKKKNNRYQTADHDDSIAI